MWIALKVLVVMAATAMWLVRRNRPK